MGGETQRKGMEWGKETLRNWTEWPVRWVPIQHPFNCRSIPVHIPSSLNGHPVALIKRGNVLLVSTVCWVVHFLVHECCTVAVIEKLPLRFCSTYVAFAFPLCSFCLCFTVHLCFFPRVCVCYHNTLHLRSSVFVRPLCLSVCIRCLR